MTHPGSTPASDDRRALAPDLSQLPPRAVRAWTQPMAVTALDGETYTVFAASGNSYRVDLAAGRCTCPDHTLRGARCKHLRRVAIEVSRGLVPPPGRREITCAACRRPAFVAIDAPALCPDCAYAPGTPVRDRLTGDLLFVAEATDRRADAVTVGTDTDADVDTDTATDRETAPTDGDETATSPVTVATYPNNRAYPAADPVVYAVYPYGPGRDDLADRRRYAFPHSRLLALHGAEARTARSPPPPRSPSGSDSTAATLTRATRRLPRP